MRNFFSPKTEQKSTSFQNQSQNDKKFSEIQKLPSDFFEKVLEAEMKLKTEFSMETLQELMDYYSLAIEYYSSIGDKKYERYNQSLQMLLSQPDVLKHINMQTANGKRMVIKQERKQIVLNAMEKIDKNSGFDIKNYLDGNNNNKENEISEKINNDILSKQESNFKKKLEEKKKKNKSNENKSNENENKNKINENNENKNKINENNENKNKINENENKNNENKNKNKNNENKINENENKINENENENNNIKHNKIHINNNNNKIDLTSILNQNLNNFFDDFEKVFNEEIIKKIFSDLKTIFEEKKEKILSISEKSENEIKECESKLTLIEDNENNKEEKENLIKKINFFEEMKNEEIKMLNEEFDKKIEDFKNNFNYKKYKEYFENYQETYANLFENEVFNSIGK